MDAVHASVRTPSPAPARPLHGVPAADHAADWALVTPHRDRLVAVARGRGMSLPDAQDVAHHVLCRAVERGGLAAERVEAYLVKAVVSRCHDLRDEEARRAQLLARSSGDDRLAGPVDDAVCDRAQLRWLLGKLPDRERAVVLLSAAGEPVVGIAAKTGLSYPTVDRLLSRARKELRRLATGSALVAAAVWRQRRLAVPSAATAAVAVASMTGLVLHTPAPHAERAGAPPVVRRAVPAARPAAARAAVPAARPAVRATTPDVPVAAVVGDAVRAERERTPGGAADAVATIPVEAQPGGERVEERVAKCLREGVAVELGSRVAVVCGDRKVSTGIPPTGRT